MDSVLLKCLESFPSVPSGKRIAVRLKPKGVRAMRQGHPWIFEDSIEKLSHEACAGTVSILFDGAGEFLGAGLYDPDSDIRIRALLHGQREVLDGTFLEKRIASAMELRKGLSFTGTDAFRALNGDSDGFPGLVADLYADALVVKIYSSAWIPWLGEFIKAFGTVCPWVRRFALRLSRDVQQRTALQDGLVLPVGESPLLIFKENNLRFEADIAKGQKTGFFLDQRDNRAKVGELAAKANSVLNLFSYTGGFSLYAARGGAGNVMSVDFSRPAIEAAKRNFAFNLDLENVRRCHHEGVSGDAFEVLDQLHAEGRLFDLVIADPPSFAKCEAEIPGALRSYRRLCKDSLKALRPGGILVFASCSSRVGEDLLFKNLHEAAQEAGRPLREFARTAHALDHPAKFKESSYLKCLYSTA